MRCLSALIIGICLVVPVSAEADGSLVPSGWFRVESSGQVLTRESKEFPVDLTVDDDSFMETTPTKSVSDSGLCMTYDSPIGRLTDQWTLFPALGANAWLRTLSYVNTSDKSQDIASAVFRLCPVRRERGALWNPHTFWMGEASDTQSLCISYRGTTDFYRLEATESGTVAHIVDACWRLAPGETATVESQALWLIDGGIEVFRREAQRWYTAIGLQTPPDMPEWLPGAILYECNAGGHIDSRFSDGGGFKNLAQTADYIAGLGVTAIWLQSVFAHKTPPDPVRGGWNLYSPRDFTKVDDILGGPDGLRELMAAFQRNRLHILGELVPHGGNSVQAVALPQWWTYRRDGQPARNWGCCAMDYSSPEWQNAMRDTARILATEFGFEGIRVDVADGSGPNWKAPGRNQASGSTLRGSVDMLKAMREGLITPANPSPVLIPENMNTVEHFATTWVAYGHTTASMFSRDLPSLAARPDMMADCLRDFFERERGAYPVGARVLRTLGNHDSVCETGRAMYRYGVGLARTLYGVCLMVPGIPMIYQEEETGSYEALRKMNLARSSIPEFWGEQAGYPKFEDAAEVFAAYRPGKNAKAFGLSNLSGVIKRVTITGERVPGIVDGAMVYDAVSGRKYAVTDGKLVIELEPYGTALCRVGAPPEMDPPATPEVLPAPVPMPKLEVQEGVARLLSGEQTLFIRPIGGVWTTESATADGWQARNESGTLSVIRGDNGWQVNFEGSGGLEVQALGTQSWSVSARSALLDDRVIQRHKPFPRRVDYHWDRSMPWVLPQLYTGIAPTGRLWQSILEPLHPEKPALAFTDSQGTAFLLGDINTDTENVVLTDRSDEGLYEPFCLALRFLTPDPDLARPVAALGPGSIWSMELPVAGTNSTARVAFTVHATNNAMPMLAADRLPVLSSRPCIEWTGGQHQRNDLGWWLIEPGEVRVTCPTPPPGTYRIRLELRKSEKSIDASDLADAYQVQANGETQALEWVPGATFNTGNAWFGYALLPAQVFSGEQSVITIRTLRPWCAIRPPFHLTQYGVP